MKLVSADFVLRTKLSCPVKRLEESFELLNLEPPRGFELSEAVERLERLELASFRSVMCQT
jgi:hypothetical protein